MLKSVRSRAEGQFAATRKKDKLVLNEREKARQEIAEHVAKLRALRLANEAANKIAAEKAAAEKAAAKKAAARKAAARKAAAKKAAARKAAAKEEAAKEAAARKAAAKEAAAETKKPSRLRQAHQH